MKTYQTTLTAIVFGLILIIVSASVFSNEGNTKTIYVKLMVPDTTWMLSINEVYQVNQEIWVISHLNSLGSQGLMGAMMISTVEDEINITAPNLPVKYFIIGKTWGWKNKEPYTFIDSKTVIQSKLDNGQLLFKRNSLPSTK